MHTLRQIITTLFQSHMGEMTFPRFFNYVNEQGKITARSLMDVLAVVCTFLEDQEKRNARYDEKLIELEQKITVLEQAQAGGTLNGGGGGIISIKPTTFESVVMPTEKATVTPEAKGTLEEITKVVTDAVADRGYPCPDCDKVAKSEAGLLSHRRTHTKT